MSTGAVPKPSSTPTPSSTATPNPSHSSTPPLTGQPPPKVRHEWFQNDNFVTISVFVKNAPKDAVSVDLGPRDVSLSIKMPNSDFVFDLGPLSHEIVPDQSKWSVLSTKIEIKLKKQREGTKWGALEGANEADYKMAHMDAESAPAYPSSSKKAKNWDSISKSVDDEKPEGEAALNALFQTIYKDATPETQRAMIKSFTESNGTCLSTNWEEVGSKRVEVTPPEGMVAKKYEK